MLEQKQGRTLTERGGFYKVLVDNTLDVLTVLDESGMILYVSPSATSVWGHAPEEMMGMNSTDYIHPDDYALWTESLSKAKQATGDILPPVEVRVCHKDGSWRFMERLIKILDESFHKSTFVVSSRDITDRRLAEQALRESEEKYRILAENTNDLVWMIDARTFQYLYLSPSVERMTGFSREEAMQTYTKDFMSPSTLNMVMGYFKNSMKAAAAGLPAECPSFEVQGLRKDGSLIWHEITYSLVYDKSGRVIAIQGTSRDSTDRKRAEEALRRSEEQYRKLVDSMGDAVLHVDPTTFKYLYANPAAFRISGYSPAELMTMHVYDLVPPEDYDRSRDYISGLLKSVTADPSCSMPPLERRLIRKDGKMLWIESTFTFIDNEQGVPAFIQTVSRDITERKQAEEALRKSEERFRYLTENMKDIFWVVDLSSRRFQYISPVAEKYFLYTPEELVNMDADAVFTPASRKIARDHVQRAAESAAKRIPFNAKLFELEFIRKDGSHMWGEVNMSMNYDTEGNLVSVQGVTRDITERKKSQEELEKRTDELARSNADLEQFAYIASHDLQEPLRMVASFTELLARRYKGKLDRDADEFIQFAVDGANRMKQLVNDLLAYSRVGTRGSPPVPVDCHVVLKQVLINLDMAVNNSRAAIHVGTLPTVLADAGQLAQVFQNLITNAIKFCGAEAPVIEIAAEQQADAWLFSVRDNGIGIEPQYFEEIFAVFQRVGKRQDYPGTGIGLAICKKIVERHGGRIWVESQPDDGSTFYFTMPR